ncbi:hypothetical protein ACFT0G_06205 [Streptomyces sp. NPDC057020]|uniref:hypothetical protein n=1 Tax=unclassified Streptomyces TaxID=2593676 RepID=UPI003636E414
MTNALVYVCAERRPGSTLAQERAIDEGHDFADRHGLTVVDTITDPYGEPDPQAREGWQRVRALAEDSKVSTVITRWPNALSPDADLRYAETNHLQDHGVRVLFSWSPLATMTRPDRP